MENIIQAEKKKPFQINPAVVLWLIAPVFGELFSGSSPLNEYINPWLIILFGMLYGSGALLVREFVIRFKKGWISLLLLGMAFGIFEEGLMVQSFFNPDWGDLGILGVYGRVWGVNWVWLEHLTIYHALISILSSITFVEMLYPDQRQKSWIGKKGRIFNAAAFFLTLPLGFLMMPYNTPIYWLAFCWLLMGFLVFLAWLAPSAFPFKAMRKVPRPRRFWWIGLIGFLIYFYGLYMIAEQNQMPFIFCMLTMLLYCLIFLWLILRFSGNAHQWDDRHRMALLIGGLSFFLIFGPVTTGGQYPVMFFSNPVFLLLLWLAYRKVDQRVKTELAVQG